MGGQYPMPGVYLRMRALLLLLYSGAWLQTLSLCVILSVLIYCLLALKSIFSLRRWDFFLNQIQPHAKLLLLPTVSLAEISRSSNGDLNKGERWKMIIYMGMSLVFVNISLSAIRIFLIIKFKALKPSRIFLGKNLIFFCVQTLKLCKAVKENGGRLYYSPFYIVQCY